MRKMIVISALMLIFVLSACSAQPNKSISSSGPISASPVVTQDPKSPKMECQVVSSSPTQGPTQESMFPAVQSSDWVLGSATNPAMTVMVYSDFQCPYCARFAPLIEQFVQMHPQDVRVVFRYFPLPTHALSLPTAYAAQAAGMQGKFWEMHDAIFAGQGEWATQTEPQFQQWASDQAQKLGLDQARFLNDMQSKAVTEQVQEAQKHALDIGIPGTPFVLINGSPYQGPVDLTNLEAILTLSQLKDRQFTYCPPMTIDPQKQYTATVKTSKGNFVIQLFPDKAPMTVNSFVFLARQGWFNNVPFHRVLPDFIAQTGDPSGSGFGGPGYSFNNEPNDLRYDKEGVVGMANSASGTSGSQFFITYKATPNLDQGSAYTIFGQVIDGMDVVKQLTPRDPSQSGELPKPDMMLSVEIQEK